MPSNLLLRHRDSLASQGGPLVWVAAELAPPEEVSTSTELHKYVFWLPIYGFVLFLWLTIAVQLICRFDRVHKRKVTDFSHHHRDMVDWWRRSLDDT